MSTPTTPPPPQADARLDRLRLCRIDGLGPRRLEALLEAFGSPAAILNAPYASLLRVPGVGNKLAEAIRQSDAASAQAELEAIDAAGVRLLFRSDADYPPALAEIADAPLVLTYRGTLLPQDGQAIAIVGSRRCSAYGRRMTERLAADLARKGFTIVSGLARGIDAVAHRAALDAGGRTLAVLASGVGRVYPPEHADLADDVAKQGAVLSEASLHGVPEGGLFPRRNRIISGLSLGVVVIEAGSRSGALSTARHAANQSRELFALPGRVTDTASDGCNMLIREGACLVRHADDVLEELGPIEVPRELLPEPASVATPPPGLDDTQRAVWSVLSGDPLDLETLVVRTKLRASTLMSALCILEIRKVVRRHPGNSFSRG